MEQKSRARSLLGRIIFRGSVAALVVVAVAAVTLLVVADRKTDAALRELRSRGYPVDPSMVEPPEVSPELNGAPFLTAAASVCVDPTMPHYIDTFAPPSDWGTEDRRFLREYLDANRDAFELVRRARTLDRTRYHFKRDYSAGINVEFPEAGRLMQLGDLLAIQVGLESVEGRHEEARECFSDILTLSEAYRNEPFLFPQLIRFAIVLNGCEAVQRSITSDTSSEHLEEWLEVVPDSDSLNGAAVAASRGEMANLAHLVADPSHFFKDVWVGDIGLTRAWLQVSSVDSLLKVADLMDCTRLEPAAAFEKADQIYPPSLGCFNGTMDVVDILRPAMKRGIKQQAMAQAALAVTRQGLEFELHRTHHGSYPESTSIIDPFTGSPLILDREKGLIRSAGPPKVHADWLEDHRISWELRSR